MKTQIGLLVAAAFWLFANVASAHLNVTSHDTRPRGDQKRGPCEGAPRGDKVYTYAPGETITITIDEYIAHPGWFRIAFDDDGEDDLLPPSSIDPPEFYVNDAVLMDDLDSHTIGGGTRSWEVTLPEVECDNCTLQVIQVMLDKLPYDPQDSGAFSNDLYFRCIDIELVDPNGGTADPEPGDMEPGDMEPGDMDPGGMEPGDMGGTDPVNDPTTPDPMDTAGDPMTGDPMTGGGMNPPPTQPMPDPASMTGTGGTGTTPPAMGNGNAGNAGNGTQGTPVPQQNPQPTPGAATGTDTNSISTPVAGQGGTTTATTQPTTESGESDSGCSVTTRPRNSTTPMAGALAALVVGTLLARRRMRR